MSAPDVRMKGFAARADVAEVERFIAAHARALPAEPVPVAECAGRVLAEDVVAPCDVPGFARAAMDGYALRGEESFGASDTAPLAFALVGEAMPGAPFAGCVAREQAVRIMTGAPLPAGADAVAPAEVCEEEGARVWVRDAVAPQRHVGARGEDVRAGTRVLERGRRLRAQDAGLLASLGVATPRCHSSPCVRLIVSGDELLPAGSTPRGAHIADANSVVLRALLARDGAHALPFEILPDDPARIRAALAQEDADVLLVSGGSSVGREDHAPRLVAELGTLHFHGVAMRPSSPTGVGRIGARWVFLLPGNPVSCLCAYEFFAGPALRALGGRSMRWPHRRARLPLARKLSSAIGRVDYVRVALEGGRVAPLATSGASILSSTVRAAGAVVVPRDSEGLAAGECVEIFLYDDESAPDVLDAADAAGAERA